MSIDSFTYHAMTSKEKLAVQQMLNKMSATFLFQIPYFEFEKLLTREEQVQYLHNKIFPIVFKFNRWS